MSLRASATLPASSSRRAAATQPGAWRGLVEITLFSSVLARLMSPISASLDTCAYDKLVSSACNAQAAGRLLSPCMHAAAAQLAARLCQRKRLRACWLASTSPRCTLMDLRSVR